MFELEYADASEIPSEVKHLYREVDGKYVIAKAGEVKTQADIDRLQTAVAKEREAHKETKSRLYEYSSLGSLDDVQARIDRFDELEAASSGKIDDAKIEEIVQARLKSKIAPIERKMDIVALERDELRNNLDSLVNRDRQRTIQDHIRKAAMANNVRDTAIEDAILLGEMAFTVDESGAPITKDGALSPGDWMQQILPTRPHWCQESKGVGARGGANGSFTSNPFSADGWNMTEQGRMVVADRAKAEQMAKAAGTTVGGPRPKAG